MQVESTNMKLRLKGGLNGSVYSLTDHSGMRVGEETGSSLAKGPVSGAKYNN